MDQTAVPGQIVSDAEIEAARLMLRIVADIRRLDELTDANPRTQLPSTNRLTEQTGDLWDKVVQTAHFTGCPALRQLLTEHTAH